MKTNLKKQFLEELSKVPIIQVACEKTGISRQTFYRWKKGSKTFSHEIDKSLREGVSFVNDMSETQLMNLIKGGEFKAVSFWLKHRNDNYKQKVEVTTVGREVELNDEQKAIIKQALALSNNNVKNHGKLR